jgi:multidrug efflux pump subunit AcrA (membrane-fusion protein)
LVVLVLAGEELDRPRLETLRLACELTAPRLVDLRAAEEWLPVRLWRLVLLRAADLFGPRHTALKLASACVLLVLALSLSLRGDLTVSAPLTVEGVHSYTHTAPVDSFLVEVRARPGDLVHEGAVLGRLDATEIQLEIAAQEAQYRIHKNQGSHLRQEGKEAESALAELEAEKTAVNLRWARTRLAMTELRASVTGYLVSEDMFPRLGQPVRRGQELFEVADTASLRVVLRVREEDIADLDRGGEAAPAAGEFTLTAYPSERIPFAVERIHPFATVTKGGNGFEVRGTIGQAPPSIALRPGMEGYAQVVAGRLSLLSLWTRKLANKVRLLCWEWL